eukprot:2980236-Alexandrium_andersonii.AAC.1
MARTRLATPVINAGSARAASRAALGPVGLRPTPAQGKPGAVATSWSALSGRSGRATVSQWTARRSGPRTGASPT